jgi:hypothetical protein
MGFCGQRARQGGTRLQLAEVLRAALTPGVISCPRRPAHHWKTLNALLRCHTAELGGHLYRCQECGKEHFIPHSCRNRHCPSCQRATAAEWLKKQSASLLPVAYFHVVFTLPHPLNGLIAQNQRALYKLLFDSAGGTLLQFGERKLKAQLGVTAVLHTWGQTLVDHYHLHCIVTGGGLTAQHARWQGLSGRYLFPVKALSKVFRAKFRDGLKKLRANGQLSFHGALAPLLDQAAFDALLSSVCAHPWVVYSKKPFAGPQAVLAYLSRYTHRVAIGNGRLLALDQPAGTVTFSYKDYADRSRRKKMELTLSEFLRRFCLHILPERLVKIRHYGLLGNRHRAAKIAAARAQLAGASERSGPALCASQALSASPSPLVCPSCGAENLILVERRGPAKAAPQLLDSS